MQELLVKELQEEQLLRDITGVQVRQIKLLLAGNTAMTGQIGLPDFLCNRLTEAGRRHFP